MQKLPAVSLVICTFNGSQYLPVCIASILPQLTGEDELLIVDDGSSDATGEMVRELCSDSRIISVVNAVNRGLAYSRNRGWQQASNPVVLYVDVDTELFGNTVQAVKKIFAAEPGIGAVGGRGIEHNKNTLYDEWRALFMAQEQGDYRRESPPFLSGLCLAVRRDIFEKTGGFNPVLKTHAEDVDFSYRLRAAGIRYIYDPEIQVFHRRCDSLPSLSRMVFNHISWACRVHDMNGQRQYARYAAAAVKLVWRQAAAGVRKKHPGLAILSIWLFLVRLCAVFTSWF